MPSSNNAIAVAAIAFRFFVFQYTKGIKIRAMTMAPDSKIPSTHEIFFLALIAAV